METIFTKSGNRWIIENEKDISGDPILLDSSIEEDKDILNELKKWEHPVDELTKEEVGETKVLLEGIYSIL